MSDVGRYESPLSTRYASPAMQRLWSPEHRATLWRRLWLDLAELQRELGVDIPEAAIEEMRAHLEDIDFEKVKALERRMRHDVMAHIHAFGEQAPGARPFIHLGATSTFVTDNADLIIQREALRLLLGRLAAVVRVLRNFSLEYRGLPTVAYTHFQPAQLTTVGKRAALWLHDFASDAQALQEAINNLPFRGCKGTTGTQASFLDLFGGDHSKVRKLDSGIAAKFGFARSVPVSGQTYSRKIDSRILDLLSGVAESASKFATDLRLLQHEGEVLEPIEQEQVGSSAMPYKRNPMRAERVCALARFVITLRLNAAYTAATQWLERTLDDSANRRLAIPEAFLAADGLLVLVTNVAAGLEVKKNTIEKNLHNVMPFVATERWLMLGVQSGGDRQELHEVMRKHSNEVRKAVESGGKNDLVERLAADHAFAGVAEDAMQAGLDPRQYVGRAPEQVMELVTDVIDPLLESLEPFSVADEPAITV